MQNRNESLRPLIGASICLALCLLLPFLTGQIPVIGNALSPMHIPVLLCGFLFGWKYGAAIGFIAPLLRFVLFGMPPLMPTGIAMAFELAAYGALTGLLYAKLPKRPANVYLALILSMLGGRVVWGIVRVALSGVAGNPFTWQIFLTQGFVNAIPGIICHIIVIPVVVLALQKSRVLQGAQV